MLVINQSSSSIIIIQMPCLIANMSSHTRPQVFAPIAFVSSLIGVTGLGWLVRKSGRASIIILLMVCWRGEEENCLHIC